jgi:hypothetical protein
LPGSDSGLSLLRTMNNLKKAIEWLQMEAERNAADAQALESHGIEAKAHRERAENFAYCAEQLWRLDDLSH